MIISLDEARCPPVMLAIAYWRSIRYERSFPARSALTLRGLAPVLPYSLIVAVIDGGADYEYRYVGEAERQAFQSYFRGVRLSQIEARAPAFGSVLRVVYDMTRIDAAPFIIRGKVDHEVAGTETTFHETAFLPLGEKSSVVDHLLIVGVQVPEAYYQLLADQLRTLAKL